MNTIKRLLLARFIPHRTAIGLGLLVISQAAQTILGSDICTAASGPNAACDAASKILGVVAPWLVIMRTGRTESRAQTQPGPTWAQPGAILEGP